MPSVVVLEREIIDGRKIHLEIQGVFATRKDSNEYLKENYSGDEIHDFVVTEYDVQTYTPKPKPKLLKSQTAKIVPMSNVCGTHRTGGLTGLTKTDIDKVLGFKPNVDDDPCKVKYSWGFQYKGHKCAIWDYKGSWKDKYWSTYGPAEVFKELFGQ